MVEITPNYKSLASRNGLSLSEIALLICDVNPDLNAIGSVGFFEPWPSDHAGGIFISSSLYKLLSKDKVDLIKKTFDKLRKIKWDDEYIYPGELIKIAQHNNFRLPNDFIQSFYENEKDDSSIDTQKKNTVSPQAQRKINNLLKVFAAMLHVAYGRYDLSNIRGLAGEIVIDIEKIGQTISEDTVLNYLEEAKEFFILKT